jgi:PAS domain S-box-containing protein
LVRRDEGWPLQWYFAVLVGLFIVAAAAAVLYVHTQASTDARRAAERDASFTASTAAKQLGNGLALLQATVRGVAASPQIGKVVDHPALCSLAYSGGGGLESGHIDILRPDGSVLCSSLVRPGGAGRLAYARADWLGRARTGAIFVAPVLDPSTVRKVAIAAAPIGTRAIVAGFTELAPAGPDLASLYGGGHPIELLITSGDTRTVITRSINPTRWIGATLEGTSFASASNAVERVDLDGKRRLYAEASVPGVGWRMYVGADEQAALAAGTRLERRQLLIILLGLAAILAAVLVVYHRVAGPITRLSAAVRSQKAEEPSGRMPTTGPAQVRTLADNLNGLIATVGHELAERRHAEEAARAAGRSYRMLFEGSPLPMWIHDVNTLAILEVNDAAIAHYGYSREEFLALTMQDITAAPHAPAMPTAAEVGEPFDHLGPFRHVKKDGAEIEVRVTAHEIMFGDCPARCVVAEDVSERERLARQLRQSQRLESLGQLAGGVAHDFNNLLGVILSYAAFVKEELAEGAASGGGNGRVPWEAMQRDVAQVEQAAERAVRLTRQLLVFSRREIAQTAVIRVNDVVTGVEELLRRTLGEHVQLVTALAGDVWPVAIDPGQFEQVLVNLAVNARDAMPAGGELTIDTENVTVDADFAASRPGVPTGRYVRLRVSDTGTGMDEGTVDRAFEPFFTTKPKGEGTGLGLATIYGIVTQAGGRVQIYSESGLGTTVSVMLPATGARSRVDSQPSTPTKRVGGHETILLVEDQDALREVTARMLDRNGYKVLTAGDGAEAIDLASHHEGGIDLLLTDVVMPHMLGREVAASMLALRPGIRVLYISGYARPVLGAQGTLEPGVTLLEKPFTEPALLAKIRQVIDARSVTPDLTS